MGLDRPRSPRPCRPAAGRRRSSPSTRARASCSPPTSAHRTRPSPSSISPGAILAERSEPLDVAARPRAVLTWVVETAAALLGRDRPRRRGDLAAIGIGVPGPGRALHRPAGQPADHAGLGSLRRAGLGAAAPATCPVLVDNDVNIMALGERAVAWPGVDHLMFVKVATGIGCGRHLGRPAAARRAGHRRRHRPRARRARSDVPVPLRQPRLPRGARVGPGDRPDAARAGSSGRERQRRRRAREARQHRRHPGRASGRPRHRRGADGVREPHEPLGHRDRRLDGPRRRAPHRRGARGRLHAVHAPGHRAPGDRAVRRPPRTRQSSAPGMLAIEYALSPEAFHSLAG